VVQAAVSSRTRAQGIDRPLRIKWMLALCGCLTLACLPPGATLSADVPDAAASDPVVLQWMVGSPPPVERRIRFQDGSHYTFPQTRWTFSHWREVFPTRNIARGKGPVAALPRAERDDIDTLSFVPMGGTAPMTWRESLAANYTDGIVVLHRGRIVYERYFGALTAERPHIAFSVTKSFFGTLAAMLIDEGRLDPAAPVARYIPELAGSGFGDATVQQVLDMTTGLDYSEDYGDPKSRFLAYARAVGFLPRPPGDTGAATAYEFLQGIAKQGNHGEVFSYRSPNTDVVGWLIARVTGQPADTMLRERIWSRLGAEGDASIALDPIGTALVAGGLSTQLRDLARFGEMMRRDGYFNGQQIVPRDVVAAIRRGADRDAFAAAGYVTMSGWSYRHQWWITHDDHGSFMARGIHGQAIYVDPTAEMVIARYASHPQASNIVFDPTSLPAYRALAAHLLARPR
jgi:CubicO group peptidase (beta-lactamase class C family)